MMRADRRRQIGAQSNSVERTLNIGPVRKGWLAKSGSSIGKIVELVDIDI